MKQETLPFLADNPSYTKRFVFYVGRRCRAASIRDVAKELHLHWETVKEMEKQYMQEQLRPPGSGQNVRFTSPETGRRNGQNETEIP